MQGTRTTGNVAALTARTNHVEQETLSRVLHNICSIPYCSAIDSTTNVGAAANDDNGPGDLVPAFSGG
ncbi:MAG: hypothetical protein AAB385_09045 [Planctomycetota bacterium]